MEMEERICEVVEVVVFVFSLLLHPLAPFHDANRWNSFSMRVYCFHYLSFLLDFLSCHTIHTRWNLSFLVFSFSFFLISSIDVIYLSNLSVSNLFFMFYSFKCIMYEPYFDSFLIFLLFYFTRLLHKHGAFVSSSMPFPFMG